VLKSHANFACRYYAVLIGLLALPILGCKTNSGATDATNPASTAAPTSAGAVNGAYAGSLVGTDGNAVLNASITASLTSVGTSISGTFFISSGCFKSALSVTATQTSSSQFGGTAADNAGDSITFAVASSGPSFQSLSGTIQVNTGPCANEAASVTLAQSQSQIQILVSGSRPKGELDLQETITLTAIGSPAPPTWSFALGSGCLNGSLGCGTLNSTTGNTVTYTPPPAFAQGVFSFQFGIEADSGTAHGGIDITVTQVPVVTIENKPATIQAGTGTIDFSASLPSDVLQLGVLWSLSGPSCTGGSNPCGTLTPVAGWTRDIHYTPPAEAPPGNAQVTLTATSVEDNLSSDQFTFTITAAATVVTITDKFDTIAADGMSQTLSATVSHDPGGNGVLWSLTAGSPPVPCQPQCGSLGQPTSTTAGLVTTANITYTPPSGPPLPTPPANAPTITATSVFDPTKADLDAFLIEDFTCGTGNESVLRGEYAFELEGFQGTLATNSVAVAGSFSADGSGGISGGEEDLDQYTVGYQHLAIAGGGSSYSIGSDNRGCLTVQTSAGTTKFRFVVGGVNAGIASRGRIIEFDDTTGNGTRGAGIIRLQDTNSFDLSQLNPNYAFGVDGWNAAAGYGHLTMAGSFAVSNGSLSNGLTDATEGSSTWSIWPGGIGSIGAISSTTGRADAVYCPGGSDGPMGQFCPMNTIARLDGPSSFRFAIYMIDASQFFIIGETTLLTGRGIASANSFTANSVSGNYVIHATGSFFNVGTNNASANAALGILNLTSGNFTGLLYRYFGTTRQACCVTEPPGSGYSVDTTRGRLALGSSFGSAAYLTIPTDGISGFFFGRDSDTVLGLMESQPGVIYSTASLAGNYLIGDEDPADPAVINQTGAISLSSAGTLSGGTDLSGAAGLLPNQSASEVLTINSDGTGDAGANTYAVTTGDRIFIIDGNGGSQHVTVIEK